MAWIFAHTVVLVLLSLLGGHRLVLLYHRSKRAHPVAGAPSVPGPEGDAWPSVIVQLPLYNERYVAKRIIGAAARLAYPKGRLTIQVLDDSTDDTVRIVEEETNRLERQGIAIRRIGRAERQGFKAGALANGMALGDGELIAIFDADFIPDPDWLLRTVPRLLADPAIGMVQTRWTHINRDASALTRAQSVLLDGHFRVDHPARQAMDCYFNFNGTAGIWRRQCIEDAGGWRACTLTEDLELSYRAQMKGWRFAYAEEIAVPSEIPEDLGAFGRQQFRWSKGAMQTLRRLGPVLWRHRGSTLRQKLEGTAHLGAHFSYPLVLGLSLLMVPVAHARLAQPENSLGTLDLASFLLATVSVGYFYVKVQVWEGASMMRAWSRVPWIMAFGVGLSLSNSRAVAEGLIGIDSPFERTPKSGTGGEVRRRHLAYTRGVGLVALGHLLLFLWAVWAMAISLEGGAYGALPFQLLFAIGYGYWFAEAMRHSPTGKVAAGVNVSDGARDELQQSPVAPQPQS